MKHKDSPLPKPHNGFSDSDRVHTTSQETPFEAEHQSIGGYFLAPYVFPCLTRHGAVLLHLPRNRYYGVSKVDVAYLERIVTNWPTLEGAADAANTSMEFENCNIGSLVQSLLEADVLKQAPPPRGDIDCSHISLDGPLVSIGDEIIRRAPVRPTHFATFLFSLLSAAGSLRCLSLKSTVSFVSRRKARAVSNGYTFNRDRTAELVFVFRSLRPYFFVAEGHCLLHALTLVTFLAIYGEFPSWVLGVRTEPWAAHSWVQHGDYLLDTNPEKVCEYEPILAV